uniref:Secreted protein n=1 Tax=Panagrellus redivivus TaxID=6233 RepID=A0A7E4VI42_PANRE
MPQVRPRYIVMVFVPNQIGPINTLASYPSVSPPLKVRQKKMSSSSAHLRPNYAEKSRLKKGGVNKRKGETPAHRVRKEVRPRSA